jgi:hypothetical protein
LPDPFRVPLRLARRTFVCLLLAGSSTVALGQSAQCPVQPSEAPLSPDLRRTVVITDKDVLLTRGNFSLARTLDSIIESAPGHKTKATEAERVALLQSLLNTMNEKSFTNPDSKISVPVDQRPNEAALAPAKLLNPNDPDGMRPVGLFNRLDLAPEDLQNCGEHRIVYAKGDPRGELNRFFLIFEAALDSPVDAADPAARGAACREVARFWDGLKTKSGGDLAVALENFYYKGLPASADAPPFKPVVRFDHFGPLGGQVRGNLFVTPPVSWQLREWQLVTTQNAGASFNAVTVKNNPVPELYTAQRPDVFDPFRSPFKALLVDANQEPGQKPDNTLVQQLTAHDRRLVKNETVDGEPPRREELSSRVGMNVPNRFNDFQSVSGVPGDSPDDLKNLVEGNLRDRIGQKLTDVEACKITAEHIVERAGAVSCAGCHEFSRGRLIAPGVKWPEPAGQFVHIDENGQLSPALEREFLLSRRRVVERALKPGFVAKLPPAPAAAQAMRQTVRAALQGIEASRGSRLDYLESAIRLERDVTESRKQEREQAGAFVPVRRVH